MSDASLKVGAPAAAAAADGSAREPRRPSFVGEEHQHHAGHHNRHLGVCLHRCQVRRSTDEEPPPRGCYLPGSLLFDHILEELGPFTTHHRQVAGACLIATCTHTLNNVTWTLLVVRMGLSKRIGCTIVSRHKHFAFTDTIF